MTRTDVAASQLNTLVPRARAPNFVSEHAPGPHRPIVERGAGTDENGGPTPEQSGRAALRLGVEPVCTPAGHLTARTRQLTP